MKQLLVLAAGAALAAGVAACGGSGGSSHVRDPDDEGPQTVVTTTGPAPLNAKVDADHDNDVGAPNDDRRHTQILSFGRAASPSERRAITTLVERYYAAALAGEGDRACSLLYLTIAETVPEDDSREPGTPSYLKGQTTCGGVLRALFAHYHAQLAAEAPKLKVADVRLVEHHGLVVLRFGALPERQTSVMREGHAWKMSQIYDQELS